MPKRGNGGAQAPLILNEKDIQILRFLAKTRYAGAEHVAEALYTPGQLTTARDRLRRLAGGADHTPRFPLYRFRYPSASQGNSQRVYTLSNRGRDILLREFGVPVAPWYFRPYKTQLTYGHLRHALALTTLYVCALRWQREQSAFPNVAYTPFRLKQCRLDYELRRNPQLPVVPDLHLTLEGNDGRLGLWFEVDGATQGRSVWENRLTEGLTFIRSGGYKRAFGEARLRVCYVVVGPSEKAVNTRRKTLCRWAVETVKALGLKESWLGLLRVTTLEEVDAQGIFEKAIWHKPDAPDTPVPLFPS